MGPLIIHFVHPHLKVNQCQVHPACFGYAAKDTSPQDSVVVLGIGILWDLAGFGTPGSLGGYPVVTHAHCGSLYRMGGEESG